MKLVSVLVPIYNVERFIERCAVSLFEQTFLDIEFVFLNDCTPDRSMEILCDILSRYPQCKEKTRIISNDRNMGIAFTRNRLLDNAQGEYIYFVDSDDCVSPDAVEKMYRKAVEEDADIVSCNYYENSGDNQKYISQKIVIDKKELLTNAIEGISGIHALWKIFVKRELFYQNGIEFDLDIDICEDYVMTIKLFFFSTKIAYVKDPLYYYTVQINNSSLTKNVTKAQVEIIRAVNAVQSFLVRMGQDREYENALLIRKLLCKQMYLINKDLFNLHRYYTIFPEANKTWRKLVYRRREMILFWLAEYKLSWFIYFVLRI
jgi:glycosyltransferase involved in cell wall biosynthesis